MLHVQQEPIAQHTDRARVLNVPTIPITLSQEQIRLLVVSHVPQDIFPTKAQSNAQNVQQVHLHSQRMEWSFVKRVKEGFILLLDLHHVPFVDWVHFQSQEHLLALHVLLEPMLVNKANKSAQNVHRIHILHRKEQPILVHASLANTTIALQLDHPSANLVQ